MTDYNARKKLHRKLNSMEQARKPKSAHRTGQVTFSRTFGYKTIIGVPR